MKKQWKNLMKNLIEPKFFETHIYRQKHKNWAFFELFIRTLYFQTLFELFIWTCLESAETATDFRSRCQFSEFLFSKFQPEALLRRSFRFRVSNSGRSSVRTHPKSNASFFLTSLPKNSSWFEGQSDWWVWVLARQMVNNSFQKRDCFQILKILHFQTHNCQVRYVRVPLSERISRWYVFRWYVGLCYTQSTWADWHFSWSSFPELVSWWLGPVLSPFLADNTPNNWPPPKYWPSQGRSVKNNSSGKRIKTCFMGGNAQKSRVGNWVLACVTKFFPNGRSHVVRASRSDGSLCSRTLDGPNTKIVFPFFSFFFTFFPSFSFFPLLFSFLLLVIYFDGVYLDGEDSHFKLRYQIWLNSVWFVE